MKTDNKWPSMTADKGHFIVGKCEMVMECVLSDRALLQKKAHLLLGVIGTVVTLAIGAWLDTSKGLPPVLEHALAVEIVLLVCLGVLLVWKCLAPGDYAAPGASADQLLQPDFANQEMPWMIVGYCLLVQQAINVNLRANRRIAAWLRFVAVALFFSPLAAHVGGEVTKSPGRHGAVFQGAVPDQPAHCSTAASFHREPQPDPGPQRPEPLRPVTAEDPKTEETAAELAVVRDCPGS